MAERVAVPTVTTGQMKEVDRLMVESYGIELIQMMENAGRSLATLARAMLDGDVTDRPVVVLAGRGNNGGGGDMAEFRLGAGSPLVDLHREGGELGERAGRIDGDEGGGPDHHKGRGFADGPGNRKNGPGQDAGQ